MLMLFGQNRVRSIGAYPTALPLGNLSSTFKTRDIESARTDDLAAQPQPSGRERRFLPSGLTSPPIWVVS